MHATEQKHLIKINFTVAVSWKKRHMKDKTLYKNTWRHWRDKLGLLFCCAGQETCAYRHFVFVTTLNTLYLVWKLNKRMSKETTVNIYIFFIPRSFIFQPRLTQSEGVPLYHQRCYCHRQGASVVLPWTRLRVSCTSSAQPKHDGRQQARAGGRAFSLCQWLGALWLS